mgnify:CR=1 FL=1
MASVKEFFDGLAERVDKSKIAGMNASYLFNITGEEAEMYLVKIGNGEVAVSEGAGEAASIEIIIASADFLDLLAGKLNGQMAFLTGKLKIKGDMTLAMKLQSIFKMG